MANISNTYNVHNIRTDFPILNQKIYGNDLVYFDNGATTQKPQVVIDSLVQYYSEYNSNVHRGVHFLSQRATDAEEHARASVQQFINAASTDEIVFTRGTTEGVNLLAYAFGEAFIKEGDEIIISRMEHHSNIVPWQECCNRHNAVLRVVEFDADGQLDMEQFQSFLNDKTKIVALTWVSNSLGVINPVADIVALAHQHKVPVMLDAAQAIQHIEIDVQALDVDFLVFSGHKIYGPTGIGVLYGKNELLNQLTPYQTGGSMIKTVTMEKTTYALSPFRFEAGTPHIEGIIGLGAAINYVQKLGIHNIAAHEHHLITYAEQQIDALSGVTILARSQAKTGALSLVVDGIHPFDIGELLDKMGIAVRTGHHCCQPVMDYFHIPGTLRLSFGLYNTTEEIDKFVQGLQRAISMLA